MSKFSDEFKKEVKKFKGYQKKFDARVKKEYEKMRERIKLNRRMKTLIFFVLVGVLFLIPGFMNLFNPEVIRDVVLGFGVWSHIVFAIIYLIFLFIPFGSTVTTVAAGLIYGALVGSIVVLFLTVVLSVIPFLVARKLGKEWVEKKVEDFNVEKYLNKINENSFIILFYLRLIPSIPYEFQNYIAGLTNITIIKYMLATLLGIFPIIFILTYLGNSLTDVGGREFWIAVTLFLTALFLPPIIYFVKVKFFDKKKK